ncbi:uncharacterized protein BcabD6B2_57720 [Babesia caballi]|uniref:Uncharacterized protein n=1 Tax=Babesia caballi TaxID=5871 RepID=A0AAV4M2N9_BABCB|nr:hypothetical protein, conserved [Babesia caballi]
MWNRARVRTGSLQALAQLGRLSRRYKIEKVQRLSANFERACWRSVRCAEERAYHEKYAFLRHCVDVINFRRREGKERRIPLSNLAGSLASQFTGDNQAQLQRRVQSQIERLRRSLPACLADTDATRFETGQPEQSELLRYCLDHGLGRSDFESAVCTLGEIARLQQLQARLAEPPTTDGSDARGYLKRELLAMARAASAAARPS